jgi:hypothetical protein
VRLRAAIAIGVLLAASPALADDADGAYGRLDGDFSLEVALGGGAAFERDAIFFAGTLELRARYLDVAGIAIGGEARLDATSRIWIAADVRPLFLIRFLLGGSFRDRYWDLLVDSIGIDLGVAFLPLDAQIGAALLVGFGIDVPLVFFGHGIDGLSLRLAGRHVASLATDRVGPETPVNDWLAMGALVLRFSVATGLPAWEPRRYELPE